MTKTPEERRAYFAKWREKNREKINEKSREYYWSKDRKEKSNAATKKWYDNNKKRRMKTISEYRKENPDKVKKWSSSSIQMRLWYSAKSRAKRKNLPFNITPEDIIIPAYCPILGVSFGKELSKDKQLNPSLDRIIPEKGYVKGNISVLSLRANTLKSNMTLEVAKAVVSYIERFNSSCSAT